MASSYVVFGSRIKPVYLKTVHHEVGKNPKNPRKIHVKETQDCELKSCEIANLFYLSLPSGA